MTKRELKEMYPAKNWQAATLPAYKKLESRSWTVGGRKAMLSGIASHGQSLFACFSIIESVTPGVASWDRYEFPLDRALNCVSGSLVF